MNISFLVLLTSLQLTAREHSKAKVVLGNRKMCAPCRDSLVYFKW